MVLSRKEAAALAQAAERLEATYGVRVATAVVRKADAYPELPWKAFALAASIAGFALVVVDAFRPQWATADTALLHSFAVLAAGITAAAATLVLPRFARLFLRRTRRDVEVHHYAQALFLRLSLFEAAQRRGVLILLCLFERKIEILPDRGLDGVLDKRDWNRVIARMAPLLADGRPAVALEAGLAATEELIAAHGLVAAAPPAAHSSRPVDERGA